MDQKNFMDEFMKATNQDLTPKQAKILQAAVEIFAEKGYAATSTSEIAKRAGVAEGTIFRHYKTKKRFADIHRFTDHYRICRSLIY